MLNLGSGQFRVGHGQDAHRLKPGRPLVIGGVEVPAERGADAHSDGDVLLHALADALLSAFALGDIGKLYPPSDPAFEGIASRTIVETVQEQLGRAGEITVVNVAAVVTLDAPKLGASRERIAAAVADLLSLPPEQLGLTFKTSEGLAPDHVQASVVALLRVA